MCKVLCTKLCGILGGGSIGGGVGGRGGGLREKVKVQVPGTQDAIAASGVAVVGGASARTGLRVPRGCEQPGCWRAGPGGGMGFSQNGPVPVEREAVHALDMTTDLLVGSFEHYNRHNRSATAVCCVPCAVCHVPYAMGVVACDGLCATRSGGVSYRS